MTLEKVGLLSGYHSLDSLLGGFHSGLYLFEGFEFSFLSQFIARAIKQTNREIIYIDGSNFFNPYALIEAGRRIGVEILEKIHIARAFTAFQLDTLLNEELDAAVAKLQPRIVVITGLLSLFSEIDQREAFRRLTKLLFKLKKMAAEKELMVLLISHRSLQRFTDLLYHHSQVIVKLERISRKKLRITLVKEGKSFDLIPLPRWQTTLEDFGVIIYG